MPITAKETLDALVEAITEAKETIRELHQERSAALDVQKKQRRMITDAIVAEVERQVGELTEDIRGDVRREAEAVVKRIEADLRSALKLD